MFFQQAMSPTQLLKVLPRVSECFFVVETCFEGEKFKLAIYKYQNSYFRLNDSRLFQQMTHILKEKQGDESELLPYIEQALEDNKYLLLADWHVQVDLSVLSVIKVEQPFSLYYYEFIDGMH